MLRPIKQENAPMQSPARVTNLILTVFLAAVIFLDYWGYSQQFYRDPAVYTDVLRGTASAPAQYRTGAVFAASSIALHGRMGLRHAMTVLDALSGGVALWVLYSLLRRSAVYRASRTEQQWFGSAAYIALVQFYLLWLTWYQRPETLPTAALLACSVWLLTPHNESKRPPAQVGSALCLLLVAVAQAFVRADVAVALHAGVLIVCCTGASRGFSLSRAAQSATSALCIVAAVAVQGYMRYVAYPHAGYGTTPVFQLVLNSTRPLRLLPFVLFIAPVAWTLGRVGSNKQSVEAPLLATAVSSVIFLALWCTVGKIDEARIFLPFALALAPLTAQFAMRSAATAS